METQRFPTSKRGQDTDIIKQSVRSCLLGQRWNFAYILPRRGYNHRAKYVGALLDKLKQQLASKHRGKLLKGILFLQDNAACH
jgi:hypothetical protein